MAIPQRGAYSLQTRHLQVPPGPRTLFVEFRLHRRPTISGRVTDRDGRPMAGVKVVARKIAYMNGRRGLSYESTETNDLGEFSMELVGSGKLIVSAEPRKLAIRRQAASADRKEPERRAAERPAVQANVVTYYPGSRFFEDALPVAVGPGEHLENIDIRLVRDRTVCISSVVLAEHETQGRLTVSVALAESLPSNVSELASAELSLGERFEICGVPDGNYRLFASATAGDGSGVFGVVTLDVSGREVAAPAIRIKAPRPVVGMVVIESEDKSTKIPAGLQVQLASTESGNTPILTVNRANVEPSGAFVVPAVTDGIYRLNVFGLSDGFYVKAAMVDGLDIVRQPWTLGAGEVRVVLRNDGASVAGRVLSEKQQPVDQSAVHLVAASVSSSFTQSEWQTAFTDDDGQFSFSSVPPGSYLILATPDQSGALSVSPQLLSQLRSKATTVTVAAKEAKQIVLHPTPLVAGLQ